MIVGLTVLTVESTNFVKVNSVPYSGNFITYIDTTHTSSGSRISHRGEGVDPLGGGVDLQCGCFSAKMYAKMKELGPVGGVCWARPLDPPMHALFNSYLHFNIVQK